MSLSELQNEITSLTPAELKLLHAFVESEVARKEAPAPVDMSQYLGCTRGLMQFHPGWEDDEPPEMWKASAPSVPKSL